MSFADFERFASFLGEADARERALAEFGQGAGEIRHEDDGNNVERAARRFGQRASERRAVPVMQHETNRPEGRSRAQDRADILRVCDLIEHDEQTLSSDVVEIERRKILDLDHRALMDRIASDQPVEGLRQRGLNLQTALGEQGLEPVRGVFRQMQLADFTLRVGEGRLDGVNPI